jgi:hypothetical protein
VESLFGYAQARDLLNRSIRRSRSALKLERTKRPAQVLAIDRIEPKPIENQTAFVSTALRFSSAFTACPTSLYRTGN